MIVQWRRINKNCMMAEQQSQIDAQIDEIFHIQIEMLEVPSWWLHSSSVHLLVILMHNLQGFDFALELLQFLIFLHQLESALDLMGQKMLSNFLTSIIILFCLLFLHVFCSSANQSLSSIILSMALLSLQDLGWIFWHSWSFPINFELLSCLLELSFQRLL